MTAMSEEEGIQQNLQEDCRIGDQQANLWLGYGKWLDIVEGLTPSKTKEETPKA
jgi:hypothetical protein